MGVNKWQIDLKNGGGGGERKKKKNPRNFFRDLHFIFIILYGDPCLHSSCFWNCWVSVASVSGVCIFGGRGERMVWGLIR